MYFKDNTIQSRPNIPVSNPTDSDYKEYGWLSYDRNVPDYDSDRQKISKSDVVIKDDKAVQQWDIIDLSEEEIQQRLQEQRKQMSTSRWRLMIVLDKMDMLDAVNQAVESMPKSFQIAWNNADTITRLGQGIEMVQQTLGLSDDEIDELFNKAQQIEI